MRTTRKFSLLKSESCSFRLSVMNQISLTHAGCREALSIVFLQTFRLSWFTYSQVTTAQQVQTSWQGHQGSIISSPEQWPYNVTYDSDRQLTLLTLTSSQLRSTVSAFGPTRCWLWSRVRPRAVHTSSCSLRMSWIQSKKKKEMLDFLQTRKAKFQSQVLVNFRRGAMITIWLETLQTGMAHHCPGQEGSTAGD